MDIRAIVLIGGARSEGANATERFGEVPFAYLDVLGMSVEERVVQRLQHFGVSVCTVITDASDEAMEFISNSLSGTRIHRLRTNTTEELWGAAEEQFQRCAEEGAELVIVLRLGAYIEVDYEEMIQHHLDHRSCITQAVQADGTKLDLFVVSASARSDAADLFQSRLAHLRKGSAPFLIAGYVNHLQKTADFRRLAVDGLLARNAVAPRGQEVRPGIWLGRSARIHRKARIVAPAYIGANVKIRASTLITRGSVIERHAEVDCGTVVENTTILPFSCLGAGLDAVHCVVGFRRVAHLVRDVEVHISDEKLVGMVPLSPVSRLAGSTAALFAFIPREVFRGLVSPWRHERTAGTVDHPEEAKSALEDSALEVSASQVEPSEFPSNLAVVRRYGDH